MSEENNVLTMFKDVAERVDKRSFGEVTRESVITDLGIDSLSMMQIVGEMETELGLQIPDEDLVEIITVGDLCTKVERRIGAEVTMKLRIEERLYREYMEFFEKAERERRWSIFDDIPWDKINPDAPDELALCAETFASVEMYLPDYVAGGINVVREYFGRAWFQANWGYEESKHCLALGEYLMRSGKRTKDEWFDHQTEVLKKQWTLPFDTARQMTCYGALQEQATFVIYCKHRDYARRENDECLWTIYDFIARDEIAHTRFYQSVIKILLEEDRDGTLADLASVFANFQMPGVDLVPDYDERILKMRGHGGVDRNLFIRKVYLPLLKYLGIDRHEMLAAQRRALEARHENRTSVVITSSSAAE